MTRYAIGIDIGGTNTEIGFVDTDGNIQARATLSTPKHGDVDRYIIDVGSAIDMLRAQMCDYEIAGIGIGAPNANYFKGVIEEAPNLSFKGTVPLVAKLREAFPGQYPLIALTNDANAAAIGEMIYGGAKGMKDFVMYTLGTGVGSGIVANGDLVYGHDGFAGECGHTMLIPGGRLCGCGVRGHLEAYCSAGGMKRTAFEIMVRDNATDSLLADIPYKDLTSKDIYKAARKGDRVALEVFRVTGEYLAQGMADTICHTSPEAIFLFGGPVAAGDLLLEPIRKALPKYVLASMRGKTKILPSQLELGNAAIVGASAMVWQEERKHAGIA